MSADVEFWDNTSRKYSLKPVPSEEIYSKKLEISRKYLTPDSMVLEFGCGTGTTALKHAGDAKSGIWSDIQELYNSMGGNGSINSYQI